jgi:hypothetical protein
VTLAAPGLVHTEEVTERRRADQVIDNTGSGIRESRLESVVGPLLPQLL